MRLTCRNPTQILHILLWLPAGIDRLREREQLQCWFKQLTAGYSECNMYVLSFFTRLFEKKKFIFFIMLFFIIYLNKSFHCHNRLAYNNVFCCQNNSHNDTRLLIIGDVSTNKKSYSHFLKLDPVK